MLIARERLSSTGYLKRDRDSYLGVGLTRREQLVRLLNRRREQRTPLVSFAAQQVAIFLILFLDD